MAPSRRCKVESDFSPYFFTINIGETTFDGCLATIVTADEKKIHDTLDGVLVPCVEETV
jgi:hypothetical protein